MSSVPPRFACDVMLGRTAKWLRLLGFDVFYGNTAADAELKELCLRERRLLLTKDVALHESMPRETSRLVESVYPRQQLIELAAALRLDRFSLPPRCSLCNGELAAIARERVRELVPPYVFSTQERFQRCGQCLKLYWPGTHLDKMARIREMIRKACG